MSILLIECGPNSPTGKSVFLFVSDQAQEILNAIRQCICLVLAQKQNARAAIPSRSRSISATISEKSFQNLLDSQNAFLDQSRDRSGSDSSSSGLFPVSPTSLGSGGAGDVTTSGKSSSPFSPRNPRMIEAGLVSRMSNSELTALDERDEQLHDKGHVTGDATPLARDKEGQQEEDCQALLPFLHHRHPSDPLSGKTEDPGYSVIKDVQNGSVPRRNTISESGDYDSSKIRDKSPLSEVAQIKNTPLALETSKFMPDNPPLPVKKFLESTQKTVSFEETDGKPQLSNLESVISDLRRTSSTNRTSSKKVENDYDELDEVKDQISRSPFGKLNRRRSSSTPDLNAFWLSSDNKGKFENIYEELDELRNAAKKLSTQDVPPALPARPFSMSFSSQVNHDQQELAKKKRSLFARTKNSNSQETGNKEGVKKKLSWELTSITSRFPIKGQVQKATSSESLIGDSNSSQSLSDTYASIPEMRQHMSKRRRSSDITPASSITRLIGSHHEKVGEYRSLPMSFHNPNERTEFSLINFDDGSSCETFPRTKPFLPHGNSSDPLMRFFLDDDTFQSNPMVTGELKPSSSPSNVDLISLNDFNGKDELSKSPESSQTPLPDPRANSGLLGRSPVLDVLDTPNQLDPFHCSPPSIPIMPSSSPNPGGLSTNMMPLWGHPGVNGSPTVVTSSSPANTFLGDFSGWALGFPISPTPSFQGQTSPVAGTHDFTYMPMLKPQSSHGAKLPRHALSSPMEVSGEVSPDADDSIYMTPSQLNV